MNKELIDRFEKETNNKFYTTNIDKGEDLYSYDFVDWLIKQLPIHGIVNCKIMKWIAIRFLTYQINKNYLKKLNTKESYLIRAYEDRIKVYKKAIMFLEADSQ